MLQQLNHQIKIIALGGVGELGKNMYLIDIDEKIYILDAGFMYPETAMLGIDIVIPDISYLKENQNRIQGVFLTHGHEDHIGALPYLLEEIKIPVYGTKLTLELARANIKQVAPKTKCYFIEIDADSTLPFGNVQISFFRTNHSIPGSLGICIHTLDGAIIYTGDFKFDQSAHSFYQADIGKIASLGEKGVLCLLSESNGAERVGFTPSESDVVENMSECFFQATGRTFVACLASNISGLQHIFDAAEENGKKVAVLGRSAETVYHIALSLGYLDVADDIIIKIGELKKYRDDEVVIITTGDQGEPFKVLQKMAKGTHRLLNIRANDTVVFAVEPVSGDELLLSRTVDLLTRIKANVVLNKGKIHVSGHGSQEELKMMLNLTKPKYLVPVHGDYKMMVAHAKLATSLGMAIDHIALVDNGDILEITPDGLSITSKVPAGNVLIDGSGVGDVGSIVLRDRRLLSQDGIVIVTASLNRSRKKIAAGPEIISRGFVYMKESEEIIEESKAIVRDVIEKKISTNSFDWTAMKQEIRDTLNQFLFEKIKRRPLILPILMEVK